MLVPIGWRNKVSLADEGMARITSNPNRKQRMRLNSLGLNIIYMIGKDHATELRNVAAKEMNRGYANFIAFNNNQKPRKVVVVCELKLVPSRER